MPTDEEPQVYTVPERCTALEATVAHVGPLSEDGRWIVTVDDGDVLRHFKVDVVDGHGQFDFVPQITHPCTFSARKV